MPPKKIAEKLQSAAEKQVSEVKTSLQSKFGPISDALASVLLSFSHDLIALISSYCVWGVASRGHTPILLSSFETTLKGEHKGLLSGSASLWVASHAMVSNGTRYGLTPKFTVTRFDQELKQTQQIDIGRKFTAIALDRGSHELFVLDNEPSNILVFGCEDGVFRRNIGKQHKLGLVVGITVDHKGLVFATDRKNDKVYVLEWDGTFVRKFGKPGTGLGKLFSPDQIAVSNDGEVCVHDRSRRLQVFTVMGKFLREIDFGAEQIRETEHFAFDRAGNLVVCCFPPDRPVRIYNKHSDVICQIGEAQSISGIAGLCVDDEGKIVVLSASYGDQIRVLSFVFA